MLPEPCHVRVLMSLSDTGGRPVNSGCTRACDHRKNREVQFIYQIMNQQIIPEHTA